MKRRAIFTIAIFVGMLVDMLSTYFLVQSGYRETTGLILMFINTSPILLFLWVFVVSGTFYYFYPVLESFELRVHVETIILYFAMVSLLSGIGNMYLYYQIGQDVMSVSLSAG